MTIRNPIEWATDQFKLAGLVGSPRLANSECPVRTKRNVALSPERTGASKNRLSGNIAEACSPDGVSSATRTIGPWYSTVMIRPEQPPPFFKRSAAVSATFIIPFRSV